MTLEQFLNFVATIFGALGSVFVLRSLMRLTPKVTARLSIHTYGHDPNQIEALSEQRAESIVGATIIILALIIAIANAALTPSNIVVFSHRSAAVLSASGLLIVAIGVMQFTATKIRTHHRSDVARLIIAERLESCIRAKHVTNSEIKSFEFMCNRFLNLERQGDESPSKFVKRLSKIVDKSLPDDIAFEDD